MLAVDEIAFGDGVRWQVFRAIEGNRGRANAQMAVGADGLVYIGVEGGMARIDLGEDARWRATVVEKLPAGLGLEATSMFNFSSCGGDWFWHGGTGAIVAWKPGNRARVAGNGSATQHVFAFGDQIFASSRSSGDLSRLGADHQDKMVFEHALLASDTVTCSVPLWQDQLLVGTSGGGLQIFDGKSIRPFVASGLLSGSHRINDLCQAGPGLFAAAVDTVGVIFFDEKGRTIQVLDRMLDHRLGRVQRLEYAKDGVLWALLNDGLARIEFPSQVSRFEPMLASGLAYAKPVRHDGKLWFLADGHTLRGVYDASAASQRFEDIPPPGRYQYTLEDWDGELFATNETGIYRHESDGWRLVVPDIVNARIGLASPHEGKFLYVARRRNRVLTRKGAGFEAERFPQPGLGDVYSAVEDGAGVVWLATGFKPGRTGRMAACQSDSADPGLE